MVDSSAKNVTCWGFKEIHYTLATLMHENEYVVEDYLSLLAAMLRMQPVYFSLEIILRFLTVPFGKDVIRIDPFSILLILSVQQRNGRLGALQILVGLSRYCSLEL